MIYKIIKRAATCHYIYTLDYHNDKVKLDKENHPTVPKTDGKAVDLFFERLKNKTINPDLVKSLPFIGIEREKVKREKDSFVVLNSTSNEPTSKKSDSTDAMNSSSTSYLPKPDSKSIGIQKKIDSADAMNSSSTSYLPKPESKSIGIQKEKNSLVLFISSPTTSNVLKPESKSIGIQKEKDSLVLLESLSNAAKPESKSIGVQKEKDSLVLVDSVSSAIHTPKLITKSIGVQKERDSVILLNSTSAQESKSIVEQEISDHNSNTQNLYIVANGNNSNVEKNLTLDSPGSNSIKNQTELDFSFDFNPQNKSNFQNHEFISRSLIDKYPEEQYNQRDNTNQRDISSVNSPPVENRVSSFNISKSEIENSSPSFGKQSKSESFNYDIQISNIDSIDSISSENSFKSLLQIPANLTSASASFDSLGSISITKDDNELNEFSAGNHSRYVTSQEEIDLDENFNRQISIVEEEFNDYNRIEIIDESYLVGNTIEHDLVKDFSTLDSIDVTSSKIPNISEIEYNNQALNSQFPDSIEYQPTISLVEESKDELNNLHSRDMDEIFLEKDDVKNVDLTTLFKTVGKDSVFYTKDDSINGRDSPISFESFDLKTSVKSGIQ